MKDIMTPVPAEEVRAVIKKCLENAALINYNKLASEAKVEGEFHIQFWIFILTLFPNFALLFYSIGAETTIQGKCHRFCYAQYDLSSK